MSETEFPSQLWYAVRCIVCSVESVGSNNDAASGGSAYEERITLWLAASEDDAIARAEDDAKEYAEALGADYCGLAQSYRLIGSPADGAEVFSLIRGSNLGPEDYIDRFFDTGEERQRRYGE